MSEIRSQATPARDELAADIARAAREIDECFDIAHESTELADRLRAAGWSKPRTVNSTAELDALPVGTVVHSPADGAIRARFDDTHSVAFGDDRPYLWHLLPLPITVLFTPGEAG